MDISELDVNLKVETNIGKSDAVFRNARSQPFKLYGVFHDGRRYRRFPAEVAEKVNPGVLELSTNTAGGRVRFITDSPYVAIKAQLPHTALPHMPLTGSTGFDMYVFENGRENAAATFIPPRDFRDSYEGVHDFTGERRERLVTVNFPLYSDVYELYIGVAENSTLKCAPEYKINKPIVYYGSSITQGACASKPGNCYQGYISRRYSADYINLGFSGNARAEDAMADYIAGLDMSVFVYDYDHNSPSVEHYRATHARFYERIRAAHPDIPVIFMTRPKAYPYLTADERERDLIARETYEQARARGENVFFASGYELAEPTEDNGLVDGTHPTDLLFWFMAKGLYQIFDGIFGK